ncbi:murein transglycosylase [Methylobacterium sp. Leaf399]|nr:murein transglycosylase [Methylobacterium sp. Leaf399]
MRDRTANRRSPIPRGMAAASVVLGLQAGAAAGQEAAPAPPFAECIAGIGAGAAAREVPQAVIAERLLALTPDPEVLAATRNQSEFVTPIWTYLDGGASPSRIDEGKRKLQEWATVFEEIERRFGVDRFTLAAFWGVESSYGAVLDNAAVVRPVVRSLATLACGDTGRAGYWRGETIAALQLLARGEVAPERFTGSWAGAMGHTQFMPTVYQAHAVDGDGDGRRDLWNVPDALASTAAYLSAMGWRPGEGWGTEATLPEGFDYALADETTPRSLAEWAALSVRPVPGFVPPDATTRATLILPAGARGPAFLLLPNFSVILRYNTALAYALTVGHLSDRLRGGPAFARDWPRGDRIPTPEEIRTLQTRLTERGHAAGGIDGKIGPRTRAAIRAYQASVGLTPDGYADGVLLDRLGPER